MNWFLLSASDLNDHTVADLVDALRGEELAPGQVDPLVNVTEEVTNEIRGAIAFSGRYQVDSNPLSLPKTLKEIAVKKVTRILKGRLQMPLSDSEREDAKIYESRLKALVDYAWPVDAPDVVLNPVPIQEASPTPLISPRIKRNPWGGRSCEA